MRIVTLKERVRRLRNRDGRVPLDNSPLEMIPPKITPREDPDPNRPTKRGIFEKLALTGTRDSMRPGEDNLRGWICPGGDIVSAHQLGVMPPYSHCKQ